jgi:hypothetical protein
LERLDGTVRMSFKVYQTLSQPGWKGLRKTERLDGKDNNGLGKVKMPSKAY